MERGSSGEYLPQVSKRIGGACERATAVIGKSLPNLIDPAYGSKSTTALIRKNIQRPYPDKGNVL